MYTKTVKIGMKHLNYIHQPYLIQKNQPTKDLAGGVI